MTITNEFFSGQDHSRQLFERVRACVDAIGITELRVTKSQIAFYHHKAFAWVWMPRKILRGRGAPLVLTLTFRSRNTSARWKEIVEPAPGHFTHHLELYTVDDIDEEVCAWLREAWSAAG